MTFDILYPVRQDIEITIVYSGNEKVYLFKDPLSLVTPELTIPLDLIELIKTLDSEQTLASLEAKLFNRNLNFNQLLIQNIYSQLVYFGFIETAEIKELRNKLKDYLTSNIRPPVCAGNSYSANAKMLSIEMNDILNFNKKGNPTNAMALIAPHIDFKLGGISAKVYSPAFESISTSDFDLIVFLGTAHYKSSDYFMYTRKNFNTPLGDLQTDIALLDELEKYCDVTYDDLAHFPEHSLEFHLVLIQELFKNKKFTVLPILTGTIQGLFSKNTTPDEDFTYQKQITALKTVLANSGKKILYLSSGDLSHVGRKFEDKFDANTKLNDIHINDHRLIESLEKANVNNFYYQIANRNDKFRICGLSPFYALLSLIGEKRGKFLDYNQWYEKETESAVSFCSIAYY